MRHTKGEWYLSKNTKGVECNGKLIVTCWSSRDTNEDRLEGESWLDMRERTKQERLINNELEPIANAKLIVEAPNMIDALIKIQSFLKSEWPEFEYNEFLTECVDIDSLINKATL